MPRAHAHAAEGERVPQAPTRLGPALGLLLLSLCVGGASAFAFSPRAAPSAARAGLLPASRPMQASVPLPHRRRAGLSVRMAIPNPDPRGSVINSANSREIAAVLEMVKVEATPGSNDLNPADLRAALRANKVVLTEYQFMSLLNELDRDTKGYISQADIDATVREIQGLARGTRYVVRDAKNRFFDTVTARTDAWRETSRKYSRTVFEAQDWLESRRSTRLIELVLSTFNSGVLRALWFDIAIVVSLCSVLLLYNHGIEDGYILKALAHAPQPLQNLAQKLPVLRLPLSPFTISSPALGLLLVFRTNGAFQRFFEARALWGGVVNYCRTMTRQALLYMDDPRYIEETTRRTIVFARALKLHMRYDTDRDKVALREFTALIGREEAELLLTSTHRPCQALSDLSCVIRRANLDPVVQARFDLTMESFSNQLGACERIFKTPLPLIYTRHTARFLTFFVLTLPLAMYSELKGSIALIPIMAVIAAFKLGIEELGVQITEPFSVLPLENMCDGIEASCTEMVQRGTAKALRKGSPYAHFAGSDASPLLPPAVLEARGVDP